MSVVIGSGPPDDTGRKDALHNRDRVSEQIREHLKQNIGEEDIISAGPEKKIKVPIRSDRNYRFIFDRGQKNGGGGEGVGQGDVQPGDVLGPPDDQDGQGGREAGTEPGAETYEVWLDMAEVEDMLFDQLALPRLKPKRELAADSEEIRFNSIGRKGPVLDKKATLREHLLREALEDDDDADWAREDLRYLTYTEEPQPKSQAVIFLLMDVSGSMGSDERRIARLFFYWAVRFLRRNYTQVELVFIAHTTEAKEVSEQQFFDRRESGGTLISSAYELALDIQRQRYPYESWNSYVLHASDGDNMVFDNDRVIEIVHDLLQQASLVGYLEISHLVNEEMSAWYQQWAQVEADFNSTLAARFEKENIEGFTAAHVASDKDVWPALQKFFAKENIEGAVQ